MILDWAELEGYRSIYAQALVQLRKDLDAPIQQFFVSQYGAGKPLPFDWYIVLTSHLGALERDKSGIDETLLIPDLSFAIKLWLRGDLPRFGMMGKPDRDAIQTSINEAIDLRIETIYGNGDPLLSAVAVMEFPQHLDVITRNVGLRVDKAEEIRDMIIDMARPLAVEAWECFSADCPPASISMFRPPKEFNPTGHRQYYR